ncbi:type VI secretion system TssO [uncultured Bacteroides sp.]|uniref:type VI secretion system TssO n=1 Tax=uncultured Bacteroides sp. TaxID=162156 RepID=UPI002598CF78|nr:type VI secretion system TssO [uncultured Bacteroides sp.]
MTKDEVLWGNIRFFLLLAFSVALVFIVLCRYMLDVPTEDSSELIHDINHSERIFEIQRTHAQRANVIWNEIDSLDFNTHQVQRMDEVKDAISQLQYIYKENNMSTKFFFGVLSSKTLKFQFDTKEELNRLEYNNALIERDLEECKANL